jgi:hypothetical protein
VRACVCIPVCAHVLLCAHTHVLIHYKDLVPIFTAAEESHTGSSEAEDQESWQIHSSPSLKTDH